MKKRASTQLWWMLFLAILLPANSNALAHESPWVAQSYTGDAYINVECGENVLIAASFPFPDTIYIFDNYSGSWRTVNLPNTLKILAAGDIAFAFSDSILYAYNAELQTEDFIAYTGVPLELSGGPPDVSYACSNTIAMFITDENMYAFDAETGGWQTYSYGFPSDYNYGLFWARDDFAAAILRRTGNAHAKNVVYSTITKTFHHIDEGCSGSSLDYFFEIDHGFAGARWLQGSPTTRLAGYSAFTNEFSILDVDAFVPGSGEGNYRFTDEYTVFATNNTEDMGADYRLHVWGFDTRRNGWTHDTYTYPQMGAGTSGAGQHIGGQLCSAIFQPQATEPLTYGIFDGSSGTSEFLPLRIEDEFGFGNDIHGLCGGTVILASDSDSAWGYNIHTNSGSYINHYGEYNHTETFAGEDFATFCAWGSSDRMMIYFYHGPTNSWTSTDIGMKTGSYYSTAGSKYLFCLRAEDSVRETIFYSSLTNTYEKVAFPGGVIGQLAKSDVLAFANSPTVTYFFDGQDGSLSQLNYPLHVEGITNSAALTYDDNTNIAYGYNAMTQTWTQTAIVGDLTLPPMIEDVVGLIPVDSRRDFYAYSAEYDFWAKLDVNNNFKSGFVGQNIACIRDPDEKILYAFYPQGVVKCDDETKTVVPDEFKLLQNYPNPFNPTTTIAFSLPSTEFVTLKVYNVLGQEVRTLVHGLKEVGIHHVKFDASSLSSGVYFYRLDAGGSSYTRKMLLIK
jgi:hypothetical protein